MHTNRLLPHSTACMCACTHAHTHTLIVHIYTLIMHTYTLITHTHIDHTHTQLIRLIKDNNDLCRLSLCQEKQLHRAVKQAIVCVIRAPWTSSNLKQSDPFPARDVKFLLLFTLLTSFWLGHFGPDVIFTACTYFFYHKGKVDTC